jgi:hypothetical protein
MYFKAIRKGLQSKPSFIRCSESFKEIDQYHDWYESLFYYTEDQVQAFIKNKTLSGIKDTVSDRLYFDFDCQEDPEKAKTDAESLLIELENKGIGNARVFFSGQKGFNVEVSLDCLISPSQFKSATFFLASKFRTFDTVVNDPNRIIRICNTAHPKTGLFKVALDRKTFSSSTIDMIRAVAKTPQAPPAAVSPIPFQSEWITEEKAIPQELVPTDIDFSRKVKGWPNCKWALLSGYEIRNGSRNDKLMVLIAHAKYLNYSKTQAYYLAKNADEAGISRYGGNKTLKQDLWMKIEHIYSDFWRGGIYSCSDHNTPWLTELCQSLGDNCCKPDTESFLPVDRVFEKFVDYTADLDKSTIKTGVPELDAAIRITGGQMVGILGAPSSGKTALALQILENTNKQNLLSVFYSLDMASSELFQKIAQRVTGFSEDKLFAIMKKGGSDAAAIKHAVCSNYNHTFFSFSTGVSVAHIEKELLDFEEKFQRKVNLLLLDYNELLSSPYPDPTASGGYNAGQIKRLTNDKGLVTISLLQPPKTVGDASTEIVSYRSIKGSSLLEQSFSIILGINRPGFQVSSKQSSDYFMTINVLKNRLGKLHNLNFYWDGATGQISSIDSEGIEMLRTIKDSKQSDTFN